MLHGKYSDVVFQVPLRIGIFYASPAGHRHPQPSVNQCTSSGNPAALMLIKRRKIFQENHRCTHQRVSCEIYQHITGGIGTISRCVHKKKNLANNVNSNVMYAK